MKQSENLFEDNLKIWIGEVRADKSIYYNSKLNSGLDPQQKYPDKLLNAIEIGDVLTIENTKSLPENSDYLASVFTKAIKFGNKKIIKHLLQISIDKNLSEFKQLDIKLLGELLVLVTEISGTESSEINFLSKEIKDTIKKRIDEINIANLFGFINLKTLANFVELGAAIEKVDWQGKTYLIKAIEASKTEEVAILLSRGADVNRTYLYLQTPLHIATQYTNEAIVNLLVGHGADLNAKDLDQKTPFQKISNFSSKKYYHPRYIHHSWYKNEKTGQYHCE